MKYLVQFARLVLLAGMLIGENCAYKWYCIAEKLSASPGRKGSGEYMEPLHMSSSTPEDPRVATLHDLNDKLVRQVSSLRTEKENLKSKVVQLEGELTAVSYSTFTGVHDFFEWLVHMVCTFREFRSV